MNKPGRPDDKLKKMNIAHNLFSELLRDGASYPSNVKQELEEDLATCGKKIKKLKFHKSGSTDIQKISGEPEQIDIQKVDKSHFEKKYEIVFHSGAQGQKGYFVFDGKTKIGLSGIENDICFKLFNALQESWSNALPKDIGWVSYDDLRRSVAVWKKKIFLKKDEESASAIVTDQTIISAINRLNKELREKLDLVNSFDLIENGKPFLWEKHYRLRVNIGHIELK